MNLSSKAILNLPLVLCLVIFVQCQGEIKKEDLIKKRDNVKENVAEARENIAEAFALKEKYLKQQQEKMIDDLQEKKLQIELEIEKLQDMLKDSQSIAGSEINSAIKKYQAEKTRINQKIDDIRNTTDKSWVKEKDNFEKQIEKFQKYMDNFMLEVEKLEALKADSV